MRLLSLTKVLRHVDIEVKPEISTGPVRLITEETHMIDIQKAFEKCDGEYLKFERIKIKPSGRPDLCAFLLLDRLCPGKRDIVGSAEHDEIFLDTELSELSKLASLEDIIYLARCGVRFDTDSESLAMFV